MRFLVNGKIYDMNVIASRSGAPARDEENYMAQLLIDVKEAETDYDDDREAWVVDSGEWEWIVEAARMYAERQTEEGKFEGWQYEAVATEMRR